jgi:lysozyme family protein
MANFDEAVTVVIGHEGGIGTVPGDPGGLTAFGWSTATCEAWGIPLPKTPAEAAALYLKYFWNPLYEEIASQTVATKILDDCVNQGTRVGVEHLQTALGKSGHMVTVDGAFGPLTLAAVNQTAAHSAGEAALLGWFRLIQWASYVAWIAGDPAREQLRQGMANRAAWPDPQGTIAAELLNGTYTG